MGSVSSKEYKEIWKQELKENPDLFERQIINFSDTRPEATWKELQLQKMFNVIKNPDFVNKAYAQVNGFFGMDVSGEKSWNYGKNTINCKSLEEGGRKQSRTKKGRNASNHKGIAERSKKIKGRTKENNESVRRMAEKKTGMNKDTCEGVMRMSQLLTGRTKEEFEYLQKAGEKRKGRTKENNEGVRIGSEKRTKITNDIRKIIFNRKQNGEQFKEIHKWLLSLGFEIHYSSMSRIYNQEIKMNRGKLDA